MKWLDKLLGRNGDGKTLPPTEEARLNKYLKAIHGAPPNLAVERKRSFCSYAERLEKKGYSLGPHQAFYELYSGQLETAQERDQAIRDMAGK